MILLYAFMLLLLVFGKIYLLVNIFYDSFHMYKETPTLFLGQQ